MFNKKQRIKNTMRIVLYGMLLLSVLISGCGLSNTGFTKYSYEFMGSFDTLIQFMGYAKSAEEFELLAKKGQARLEELHQLFNWYHLYTGINNVKTINDQAGIEPVSVSQELIDLLLFSVAMYKKNSGVCNIAMGPVLNLWHDARTEGLDNPSEAVLPDMEKLKQASMLCDITKMVIDQDKKTVFLQEKGMSLDVGAVAKGFACQIVANELTLEGYDSFLISGGGNIVAVGSPKDGLRPKWGVGIQDPNGNALNSEDEPLDIAYITDEAVVTSGDYQRTYVVDDKAYHHLISPVTLMPADYFRAVTVIAKDSGKADFLSTTLFLLPLTEGRRIAEQENIEALWILPDLTVVTTEGMKSVLKNMGNATNEYPK